MDGPDAEGRLVPGHWKGHLILGARGASALNAISESLRKIADSPNPRPRKTLDLATPGEHFGTLIAGLAGYQVKLSRRCSLRNLNPPPNKYRLIIYDQVL